MKIHWRFVFEWTGLILLSILVWGTLAWLFVQVFDITIYFVK